MYVRDVRIGCLRSNRISNRAWRCEFESNLRIEYFHLQRILITKSVITNEAKEMCGTTYSSLQLGIPIQNPGIPGSRTIFSIPNPGIGDALIPGFRDYEKRTKCPNFTWYLPENTSFPNFRGQFPALSWEWADLTPTPSTWLRWTSFYGRDCFAPLYVTLQH